MRTTLFRAAALAACVIGPSAPAGAVVGGAADIELSTADILDLADNPNVCWAMENNRKTLHVTPNTTEWMYVEFIVAIQDAVDASGSSYLNMDDVYTQYVYRSRPCRPDEIPEQSASNSTAQP